MKKLSNYVDKVYVINLLSRTDRREFIINEMKDIGVYDDLISTNKLEIVDAVPNPGFNKEVLEKFNQVNNSDIGSCGLYFCALEHYKILKRAQYYGYERILILEDDACFLRNINELYRALDFMPENFSILHMEGYYFPANTGASCEEWTNVLADDIKAARWHENGYFRLWAAAALIYSKKGMEKYIEMQENCFRGSDVPTLIIDEDAYFYTMPLFIQESKNYLKSDISKYVKDADNTNIYNSKININDYYHMWDFK